jgi:hypothetical protein
MKVKVVIATYTEKEVEVNSPELEQLDSFWRNRPWQEWERQAESVVSKAIEDVEKVVGLPFGCDYGEATYIVAVNAMDGEAILEY